MPSPNDRRRFLRAAGSALLTSLLPVVAGARPDGKRSAAGRAPCPPALTGGESPDGGAKVDWLTATWYPDPDEHVGATAHAWLSVWLGGVMGESVNGLFGYDKGVRFYVPVGGAPVHVGRVDFGGAHHGGRARLELSGAGCSRVGSWRVVRGVLEQLAEVKLTRVDLAVDCLEGEFTVDDAVQWWAAGDFNAGGRNPRHSLVGDWLSEAPRYGRTLEIGRRENGKMLRAYEKGRQLGDADSTWTRFEVEIRNNDRDIPLEVLTECDRYFTGAYRCLERILDVAGERIRTHQKEGEISLEVLTEHLRTSYGPVVHVLRSRLDVGAVLDQISRPGLPRRLERAALGGFSTGEPPPLLR